MKIYIASDHAGYKLKKVIKKFLLDDGFKVKDLGADCEESADDYPDFAKKLCKEVLETKSRGILICGAGIGMSLVANKFQGIRAAVCTNCYMARKSRIDNNTNVLCLGQRVIGEELAEDIVRTWLEAKFSNEKRHKRRVARIE